MAKQDLCTIDFDFKENSKGKFTKLQFFFISSRSVQVTASVLQRPRAHVWPVGHCQPRESVQNIPLSPWRAGQVGFGVRGLELPREAAR